MLLHTLRRKLSIDIMIEKLVHWWQLFLNWLFKIVNCGTQFELELKPTSPEKLL